MSGNPLVSFVISTFNSEDVITENIQSILDQEYDNIEIIVVDNHSHDQTADKVKQFDEVQLVRMPDQDYGACETFNIGFESANGKYIAILDDDVEVGPNWIEELVERLESDEDVAVAQPKVIEAPDGETAKKKIFTDEGFLSTFTGCGVLARKNALKECGYYDENYFIFANDLDLAARLLNKGYKILAFPSVTTIHKTHHSGEFNSFQTFYKTRNQIWLYWRFYDRWNSILFTLYWLYKRGGKAAQDEKKLAFLKGYLSAFTHFYHYFFRTHEYCEDLEYRSWNLENILKSIYRASARLI